MQEKTIALDSKLFNKIYSFFKHPLVTLAIGILIPTVITFINTAEQEPSFYFSEPQLIAESNNLQNQLKILWDEDTVSNVYFVDFTFWNNGDKYIDPTDFIESDPINIYNSGKVKILSLTEVNKSRSELQFRSVIQGSLRSSVELILENVETLEHNDGITYHILYSKIISGDWKISGRIKGLPQGFDNVNLAFNEKGDSKRTLVILWGVLFVWLCTRIITLLIARKTILFRTKELLIFLFFLCCTTYMTVEFIFYSVSLPWHN